VFDSLRQHAAKIGLASEPEAVVVAGNCELLSHQFGTIVFTRLPPRTQAAGRAPGMLPREPEERTLAPAAI
jgi:hypothetical protein